MSREYQPILNTIYLENTLSFSPKSALAITPSLHAVVLNDSLHFSVCLRWSSGGGRWWLMARTNKYNSLNFNDIYEKKINTTNNNSTRSSSSSTTPSTNKTVLSNSRIHGNMLVLTRPSPKPIVPPLQPSPPASQPPDQPPVESDSISLRPLGRTGLAPPLSHTTFKDPSVSPKTNRFVPPHLRPGFHGREEKPEPEIQKQTGFGMRSNIRQGLLGDSICNGEEGRPKSGGGYERVRGGFEGNSVAMNRPRSSGSACPYSSG